MANKMGAWMVTEVPLSPRCGGGGTDYVAMYWTASIATPYGVALLAVLDFRGRQRMDAWEPTVVACVSICTA